MRLDTLRLPPEHLDYLRRAAASKGTDPLGIWMPRSGARLRTFAPLAGAIFALLGLPALALVKIESNLALPAFTLTLAAGFFGWWLISRRNMRPLAGVADGEFCDGTNWWVIGPGGLETFDITEAYQVRVVQRRGRNSFVTRTYLEALAPNRVDPVIFSREFTYVRGERMPGEFIANCVAVREQLRLLPKADPRRALLQDPAAIGRMARSGAPAANPTPAAASPRYPDPHLVPRAGAASRPEVVAAAAAATVLAAIWLIGPPVLSAIGERRAARAVHEAEQRDLTAARAEAPAALAAARTFLQNYPQSASRAEIAARYETLSFARASADPTVAAAQAHLADPLVTAHRAEVEALLDERLFARASAQNTLVGWREYLRSTSVRPPRPAAVAAYDDRLFADAVARNTTEAWRAYLQDPLAQLHRREIEERYDAELFDAAVRMPSSDQWTRYLKDPHCGLRKPEAERGLDRALFLEAARDIDRSGSTRALAKFLREHPDSPNAAEARTILSQSGASGR